MTVFGSVVWVYHLGLGPVTVSVSVSFPVSVSVSVFWSLVVSIYFSLGVCSCLFVSVPSLVGSFDSYRYF